MTRNNCPYCYSTDCYGYCQGGSWTPAYCPACKSTRRCDNRGYCHQCQDWTDNIKRKLEAERERERDEFRFWWTKKE